MKKAKEEAIEIVNFVGLGNKVEFLHPSSPWRSAKNWSWQGLWPHILDYSCWMS